MRLLLPFRSKCVQYSDSISKPNFDKFLTDKNLEKCIQKYSKMKFIPDSMKFDKKASVLIPLCHVNNDLCLLYTLRTNILKRHSGQISFPGGMCDEGETSHETAIRETEEEVGVPRKNIKIYGCGAPIARFGILITPTIGYIGHIESKDIVINEKEVQFAFAVPLSMLSDAAYYGFTQFRNEHTLPVYKIDGFRIWGVTAYMTHFFLKCFLDNSYKLNLIQNTKIVFKK